MQNVSAVTGCVDRASGRFALPALRRPLRSAKVPKGWSTRAQDFTRPSVFGPTGASQMRWGKPMASNGFPIRFGWDSHLGIGALAVLVCLEFPWNDLQGHPTNRLALAWNI